jgi:hypothetical protein
MADSKHYLIMVQVPRLELGRGYPPDPKSGASTNSAIPAKKGVYCVVISLLYYSYSLLMSTTINYCFGLKEQRPAIPLFETYFETETDSMREITKQERLYGTLI